MTKQVIIQIIFCSIISIAHASIKILPLTQNYWKSYACILDIDKIINHKITENIKGIITQEELEEIERIKINNCNSLKNN
jgi:hypothetical protein